MSPALPDAPRRADDASGLGADLGADELLEDGDDRADVLLALPCGARELVALAHGGGGRRGHAMGRGAVEEEAQVLVHEVDREVGLEVTAEELAALEVEVRRAVA